jgi:hypothetical protein
MQEDEVGNVDLYKTQSEKPKGRGHFEYLAVYWTTVIGDCKKIPRYVFGLVTKIAKSDCVRPSVCQCAWNSSAPTVRIFVKFDI